MCLFCSTLYIVFVGRQMHARDDSRRTANAGGPYTYTFESLNRNYRARQVLYVLYDNISVHGYTITSRVRLLKLKRSFETRYYFFVKKKKLFRQPGRVYKNSRYNTMRFVALLQPRVFEVVEYSTIRCDVDVITCVRISSTLHCVKYITRHSYKTVYRLVVNR